MGTLCPLGKVVVGACRGILGLCSGKTPPPELPGDAPLGRGGVARAQASTGALFQGLGHQGAWRRLPTPLAPLLTPDILGLVALLSLSLCGAVRLWLGCKG